MKLRKDVIVLQALPMNLRDRTKHFFSAKRSWRIRVYVYAGPWVSAGIHIDASPTIDLHLGWFMISMGRLRNSEVSGYQWPRAKRD